MALDDSGILVSGTQRLFIVTLTPAVLAYWKRQSRHGREPYTLNKMAIGALLAAAAYVLMISGALREESTGPVSWLWLVSYFLVLTLGDLYLSPTCLSLSNKTAPARMASTMLGVWYMSMFVVSYLAGASGRFWSVTAKPLYFAAMAAVAVLCALLLFIIGRTFAKKLGAPSPSAHHRPLASGAPCDTEILGHDNGR